MSCFHANAGGPAQPPAADAKATVEDAAAAAATKSKNTRARRLSYISNENGPVSVFPVPLWFPSRQINLANRAQKHTVPSLCMQAQNGAPQQPGAAAGQSPTPAVAGGKAAANTRARRLSYVSNDVSAALLQLHWHAHVSIDTY